MCLTTDQSEAVPFEKIFARAQSILSPMGEGLAKEDAMKSVFRLKAQNLVDFDENAFTTEIGPYIDLCGNQDDIKAALEDDERLGAIFE